MTDDRPAHPQIKVPRVMQYAVLRLLGLEDYHVESITMDHFGGTVTVFKKGKLGTPEVQTDAQGELSFVSVDIPLIWTSE